MEDNCYISLARQRLYCSDEEIVHVRVVSLETSRMPSSSSLRTRNKISVITDISLLGFYRYIRNIGNYQWIFDKNIGKTKINKNTLKFMEILC